MEEKTRKKVFKILGFTLLLMIILIIIFLLTNPFMDELAPGLTPQEPTDIETLNEYDVLPQTIVFENGSLIQTFPYILNEEIKRLEFTTHENISTHFKELTRSISYIDTPPTRKDFLLKNIDDSTQKKELDVLVTTIKNLSTDIQEQAEIAISLVQLLPYDIESFETETLHGRYAYEVLHDAKGACGEKSELLVFLLRELGFKVAIFDYVQENHQAVGIACQEEYSYNASGYCFIETTQPTIITYKPSNYIGVGELLSQPEIIVIQEQGKKFNASTHASDAILFEEINKRGPELSKEDYNLWVGLVNRYALLTSN
jgi:hypothetical protein